MYIWGGFFTVCMYVYIACMHVYYCDTSASIYLCIYVCTHACIYLCIYVSMYLCIYVSMYLSIGAEMGSTCPEEYSDGPE